MSSRNRQGAGGQDSNCKSPAGLAIRLLQMKRQSAFPGVLLLALAISCGAQTAPGGGGLLLSWHAAGRNSLAQGTNATFLKRVDQLPVSEALRRQIATNLAHAPRKAWEKALPGGVPDGADLLRPLIADLLNAESYGEIRGSIGRTETAIAVELSDERAAAWSTNLWQLAALWKQGAPQAAPRDGASGWALKRSAAPNRFEFVRVGKWVVLGLGPEKLTRAPALAQQIKSSGRPAPKVDAELLEVRADAPALSAWIPMFGKLGVPPLHLTMRGKGEHVRTEVKLTYAKPFTWKYEPWLIPTNLVGDSPLPLTSFTVARGVSSLLQEIPGFAELGIAKAPSQFTAWANPSSGELAHDQIRINFAAPNADPEGTVRKLAGKLPGFVQKNLGQCLGDFYYSSNQSFTYWSLPFLQPHVRAVTNAGVGYIQGGLFQLLPRQAPAPPGLFAQLGTRTNLLYYDYEITHHRLHHGNQLYQVLNMASRRLLQGTNSPAKMWASAVINELSRNSRAPSETVTEVTQTAPNELTLVRKSDLGFTGIEMASFAAFMDSPGFPFRYEPPKLLPVPKDRPAAARTNAPTVPAAGGRRKP